MEGKVQQMGLPKIVGACHCRYCQLRSGSAFGVLVYFKEAFLSLEKGVVVKYRFKSESNFQWENFSVVIVERLFVWHGSF